MRRFAVAVLLLVALSGCTTDDPDEASPEEAQAGHDEGSGGTPPSPDAGDQEVRGEESEAALTWDTHDYLFSVGATVGTGDDVVRSTSTHPAELVVAPDDVSFVRVEFRWEGIATGGATLTLAIGTGTVANLDRVADVTTGERAKVVLDFAADEWDPTYVATIAAERGGSVVAEGTVEVRSTAFVGGVPADDWTAF